MAEEKKRGAKGGAGKPEKEGRRRLGYLKMRSRELKQELQANKKETDELRQKLGMGPKNNKRKKDAAGGDDDE